jgi:hypothetical protein
MFLMIRTVDVCAVYFFYDLVLSLYFQIKLKCFFIIY